MTTDKVAVKAELDADNRNVSDLWNKAVQGYNITTGIPLATPHFKNTQDMINFGNEGAEQFQSWRHGDKRVDKLRSLFMQDIDFIEVGAKQLIVAATPAFPPAAAIGTAMTLVLSGCRGQTADDDAVVNFFEDMNNFLQRVTIIEKRVPRKKAYQNALMDVFSSLLHMCAVAHKFIALGRFKKWAINTVLGGDTELAGGRKTMDTSLSRLQSATEFAILDNSENLLEKQDVLGNSLASFQQELRRNQNVQERLAQTQALALEGISTGIQDLSSDLQDIKRLLVSRNEEKRPEEDVRETKADAAAGNPVKALVADFLGGVDVMSRVSDLTRMQVEGTGAWVLENAVWMSWSGSTSPHIAIQGNRGVGKSHLSVSIYQHFHQLAKDDSQGYVCAVYFQCKSDDDYLNQMMSAMAALVVQIVDQNAALRQKLFADLQQEEKMIEFYSNLDDEDNCIDELRDDEQVDKFNSIVRTIEEEQLRIKVVATRSSARNFSNGPVISIGQEQFRSDLRKLIWNRLHNTDSMYGGIRRLTKQTKQKLARKLEQHAYGLLYVEQMLRFLGSFQREMAINSILDAQMPANVAEIYGMMLERAQSRVPAVCLPGLKSIVTWAAFTFRPLTLKEIGTLAVMASLEAGNAEEMLSEVFKSFFEIRYTDIAESHASIDSIALFEEALVASSTANLDDDKVGFRLRDDSTKSFFGTGSPDHSLRTTVSLAHHQIFLTSVRMLRECSLIDSQTLRNYIAQFCLKHWYRIQTAELTREEQLQIFGSFKSLIHLSQFSHCLQQLPAGTTMSDMLGEEDDFAKTWTVWSELAVSLDLDWETLDYWQTGQDNALWPLAKSLLCDWLRASDGPSAIKAYNLFRTTVKLTQYQRLLDRSFDFDQDLSEDAKYPMSDTIPAFTEITGLAALSKLIMDAEAHLAIGVVLNARGDHQNAVCELQKSLKMHRTMNQRIRAQMALAHVYRRTGDCHQTIVYCDIVLNQHLQLVSSTVLGHKGHENDTASHDASTLADSSSALNAHGEPNSITPSLRSWALVMRGKALSSLNRYGEAAASYRDARLFKPGIIHPKDLLDELVNLWHNDHQYTAIMDTLMDSFKPIERLDFLTNPELVDDPIIAPWNLILLATAKTGRLDDLVKAIKILDAEKAGAPLRLELAQAQWALRHDIPATKVLLNQILDSVHDTLTYELTEADVASVTIDSASLMANILLYEFRNNRDIGEKSQILLELKDLPNRSLAQCGILPSSTWHGCRLAFARMLQRIGPASEFQAVMDSIFEECVANLRDSTVANDSMSIFMLARALAMMPALKDYAGIVLSAVNQKLDSQGREKTSFELEMEEENSKFSCDGRCLPRTTFNPWDKPIYFCLICANTGLCEDCYRTRMEWNSDSKPHDEPSSCCDNGQYLKGPVKGWQGMKDGVLFLDPVSSKTTNGCELGPKSDEPRAIKFQDLLADVEVAWKKAWEDYWTGF